MKKEKGKTAATRAGRLLTVFPFSFFLSPSSACRTAALNAEGAAAAAPAVAPTAVPIATLVSRHVLRDGELVILMLKPSAWFVALTSLRFAGIVLLLMVATQLFDDRLPPLNRLAIIEGGLFLIFARVMWAVLQWTARLYVLTDLRILSISGVFNTQIFDCPLRKVARTRLIFSTRERLVGRGSVEIIPLDDDAPEGLWQTVNKPRAVHEQVVATINKAKQGGAIS